MAERKGTDRPHSRARVPRELPERVAKAILAKWRVIPLLVSKAAYVPWKEYQDRSPTKLEYAAWADEYPNAMWAVLTGQASGVIAFDFDGDDGLATMRGLGLKPLIRTPGGGAHVYCYAPDYPVRGAARVDPEAFPNMDLRADGQLATFHGYNPERGTSYERAKGRIYPIDALPVQLQRLLVERRKQPNPQPLELPKGFSDFAETNVLLQEAYGMVKSGGSRNQAGFHLACQLRDERYTFDDAWKEMERFQAKVADSGDHFYAAQEAYNSLVSAFSSEARAPRSLSKLTFGDGYPHTDYGNAERLVARHGENVRYCGPWKRWLIWDGRRWRPDDTEEIERRAKDTVRQIVRAAADVENDEARTKLIAFARRSEANARIKALIDLAESEVTVPVLPNALDAGPMLLNVENGTIDLRTGKLHEHSRSDLLTKLAPVTYDPDATYRGWDQFLKRVLPEEDLRTFIQRAIGYSLTGDTGEEVAFLLHGTGANGKSKFLEAVRAMLGTYAQQAPSDLLLTRRSSGVPSDVARLQGARFVTSVETDEGRQLAEALFKQLTGGDRVTARYLYADFFEFMPVCKLWLATNHKPEIKETSEALWRRIHLVPFAVTIPRQTRDPQLGRKLLRELPGILRWAVEGCLAWQREGLAVPKQVTDATEEYRQDMDLIGKFLAEMCVEAESATVAASALYSRYDTWCQRQGIRWPMTQNLFGRRLTDRGFSKDRVGRDKVHTWLGIGLRDGEGRSALRVLRTADDQPK